MGSIECATNKVKIEDVEHWLKPLLIKDETIKFAVSIKAKAAKGEGQLSDVTYVEAKSNTDDPKIYKLAIKSGKTSEAMREMMPLRGICINEINFYREIVPVLVKFQEERKIQHPFNNLAECHDSLILDNMEVLILSNMKEEGYTMHSRMIPLNEEKIKQVVQAYAKFHAVSFALKDQKPEVFAELDKYVKNVLKGTDLEQTLGEKEFFDELQKIAQESNLPQVAEKLQALYKLTDAVDPPDDYAVIIHGDCENNNYLFKHHDKQAVDVCFLDFQFSRLASPIYDLSYFLFACMSKEDTARFDQYKKLYYDTLCEFLEQLGSDPKKLFPEDKYDEQWSTFAKYGLRMMFSVIRNCLAEPEDVFDLMEIVDRKVKLSTRQELIRKCSERTSPMIQLAMDKGFI